jgi:predicted membrane-bound spermidine synthase
VWLALVLFCSGAAGLVYQVLWVKQLSLIVGIDVYAVTTAVSAFFAGLAAGGFVLGRLADRVVRPVLLYCALELSIAVLGLTSTIALAHTAAPFVHFGERAGVAAWALPFALVGIPAFAMGGTLPALVRAVVTMRGEIAAAGGLLYAANTAGAIIGALLPPFLLIPTLGVRGSAIAAAALNIVAAIGALACVRLAPSEPRPPAVATARTPPGRLALALYAIAGGIALGYEVVWSQVIVQWTSTRSFAFAVVLATYLAGLAAGSAVGARRAERSPDPWGAFALLIALAGLAALLCVAWLGAWLQPLQVQVAALVFNLTNSEPMAMASRFFVATGVVVLVPTLLLGAAFPFALRLSATTDAAGENTGTVLSLNTIGGIAGTLLTGFVLVPAFGLEYSLGALAIAAGAVGAVAVLRGVQVGERSRWVTLGCAVVAIAATILVAPDHLARLLAQQHGGELIFSESGAGGTVAVIEQRSHNNRFRRLYIDGVSNSGDSITSLRYMRLQGLLPLIIHRGEPHSALVIGLGTGITCGSLLRFKALERRVCAELMPEVVAASLTFTGNYGVAGASNVDIRLRDGRRELLRSEEQYDLITLEPPPPSAAGVVNLYSTDFYRLAATRLETNGLLAQWLPLPTQAETDTRSLIRSFIDVFPYASLWTTEFHEMLLVGSMSAIELDVARISDRFERPATAAALREIGIDSPAALLSTWITDRRGLERYAAGARPVTDNDPRIEYGAWVLPDEFPRVLPRLLALRTDPPLRRADAAFRDSMSSERQRLLAFYAAGVHAYRGERAQWAEALRPFAPDMRNPYYSWVLGWE